MAISVDQADVLKLLGNHEVLCHLPVEALRPLVHGAALQCYGERELIFNHGDPGSTVMVILRGYVKLSVILLNGRDVVLDIAGPLSLIGEIAILNGWPRSATATALSACDLLVMDGDAFVRTLSATPEAMLAITRLLSRRLRKATEQGTNNLELPAPVRLAKTLIELAALHSRPTSEGLEIELPLSQRELGGMTGLIRESINRHFGAWRDAGWARLNERSITLLDLDALRRLLSDHTFI